mmetsp:Transcript_50797/g.115282  ORF Transcript_50797/g.115282 Transcript_50797/m.115282 type:complete len:228 (-) Transcript_50797:14-697(-)
MMVQVGTEPRSNSNGKRPGAGKQVKSGLRWPWYPSSKVANDPPPLLTFREPSPEACGSCRDLGVAAAAAAAVASGGTSGVPVQSTQMSTEREAPKVRKEGLRRYRRKVMDSFWSPQKRLQARRFSRSFFSRSTAQAISRVGRVRPEPLVRGREELAAVVMSLGSGAFVACGKMRGATACGAVRAQKIRNPCKLAGKSPIPMLTFSATNSLMLKTGGLKLFGSAGRLC